MVVSAGVDVEVTLPDSTVKKWNVSFDQSVEDVKTTLWDGGLSTQFASKNDFYLGFSKSDLITVEFINFNTCHDTVKQAVTDGAAVKVSVFPLPSAKAVEEQLHRQSSVQQTEPAAKVSAAERHIAHDGKSESSPTLSAQKDGDVDPAPLETRGRSDSLRDLKAKARELKSKSQKGSVANLIAMQNAETASVDSADSPRSLFFDDWDSPPVRLDNDTATASTARPASTVSSVDRSRMDSGESSSLDYKDTEEISSFNDSFGGPSSSDSDGDGGDPNDSEEEVQRFPVRLALPNGAYSVMSVTTETTVSELGMRVYAKAKYMLGSCPKNFRLKVKDQPLHAASVLARIPYVKDCMAQDVVPIITFSTPESEAAAKAKAENGETDTGRASVADALHAVAERMENLPLPQRVPFEMSQILGQLTTSDNNEVRAFRVTMKKIRQLAWQYRREPEYLNRANVNCGKLPLGEEHRMKSVIVRLHYPNKETSVSKKVEVECAMAVKKVMAMCLEKANITSDPDQYMFKVTGLGEYFMGNEQFIMYDYVRRSIKTEQQIELNIVERTEALPEEMMERDDVHSDDEELAEAREFSHVENSLSERPWNKLDHISIWDLERPFRVRICGVDNLLQDCKNIHKLRRRAEQEGSQPVFFITAELYHSGHLIESARSGNIACPVNPRWQEWLTFSVHTANLPKGTRLCLTVCGDTVKEKASANPETPKGKSKKGEADVADVKDTSLPLGWTNVQLVDHRSYLRAGLYAMKLWPDASANPIGTCVENLVGTASLYIQFDKYPLPVVFPKHVEGPATEDSEATGGRARSNTKKSNMSHVENKIEELITKDPLHVLAPEDVTLLWGVRHVLKNKPLALPKFLQSVNWVDRHAVQETHRLLAEWPKIPAMRALELLDSKFADEKVREYAVGCLHDMDDHDLAVVILQLTQVLKYEAYHDSALARFLMSRALRNPDVIGHLFFWHLKSEMHMLEVVERFGLMLEEYLRGCGGHRQDILKQNEVLNKFGEIADMIKCEGTAESRLGILRNALGDLDIPWTVKLPLNPAMQVKDLRVEKCKYMDSKKRPLWLVFDNGDPNGSPILVIFKSGDDLRQDQLTLQMIRLMDKLWQENGLDLKLKPYGCISTGDELGMIEVVLNAETTAAITRAAGGAAAAFSNTPLAKWLRVHNPTEEEWDKAVDTFVLSCAGYCVATYVLGIGDRHNDNVMLTRTGNLFHIDFGHFLGNFKKKFGIKREKAPFVFTPDFAYVMGGAKKAKPFKKFVDTCCVAYNVLRRHADLFINLFCMMLSTGIPELTCVDDIEYLRTAFMLGKSDAQAAKKFQKLIKQSLKTTTTQVNNAIHILAH